MKISYLATVILILAALNGCAVKSFRPDGITERSLRISGELRKESSICETVAVEELVAQQAVRIDVRLNWKGHFPDRVPLLRLIVSEQTEQKRIRTQASFFVRHQGVSVQIPVRLSAGVKSIELCLETKHQLPIWSRRGEFHLIFGPATPEFLTSSGFDYVERGRGVNFDSELLRSHAVNVDLDRICVSDFCSTPVQYQQLTHRLMFGTAVRAKWILGQERDSKLYRELFQRYFRSATLENELKPLAWTGEWKDFPHDQTVRALKWLDDHGYYIRGHTLYWGSWQHVPADWKGLDPAELEYRILETVDSVVRATSRYVDEWDLINEPFRHRTLTERLDRSFFKRLFDSVRKKTSVPLFVNDFSNIELVTTDSEQFLFLRSFVRDQIARGVKLDAIGLQGHFSGYPLPDIEEVRRKLDLTASLGLPIQVTELDIDIDDEALQADYLRDLLRALYSHPAVTGISFWGFWEGEHWRPSAALWRSDWSERPSAGVYRHFLSESLLNGELDRLAKTVRLVPGLYQFENSSGVKRYRIDQESYVVEVQ